MVASASKDPDRQCGCLLVLNRRVLAMGYNGFPADVADTPERLHDRDFKLRNMVHAEANAIKEYGEDRLISGATAYSTRFPCWKCANLLVNAGIIRLVAPRPYVNHERWGEEWKKVWTMLKALKGFELKLVDPEPLECLDVGKYAEVNEKRRLEQ